MFYGSFLKEAYGTVPEVPAGRSVTDHIHGVLLLAQRE